uniref:hypothetical protein n=1 Tax=Serratia fonticola TaxID=47917 RepID=UPI0013771FE0|nr:hypothetical protein [Serratia fonticola]
MDDTSESSLADHIQESPLFQAGFFTSGVYEDESGRSMQRPYMVSRRRFVSSFLGCLANDKIEMDLVVGEYHPGCTLINDAASQQRLKIRMHSFNIPLNATSNRSD